MRGRGMRRYGRGRGERGVRGRMGRETGVGGVSGRGMGGSVVEDHFSNNWSGRRMSEGPGNNDHMEDVVCVENVDENVCELVEKDDLHDGRSVDVTNSGINITVPGETEKDDRTIAEGAGEIEDDETGSKADGQAPMGNASVSQTSHTQAQQRQTGENPTEEEERVAHAHTQVSQASLTNTPAETSRPIIPREASKSTAEVESNEADNNSAASADCESANSAALTACAEAKEACAVAEREKEREEQHNDGLAQLGQTGLAQVEGRGDNGGKSKQRESLAKISRLSLGGRGDGGISAAKKLAQFKATERKGGCDKGSDKGGKSQKKDGSGAGNITTRSQSGRK